MKDSDIIKLWKDRIEEIEETGNCMNDNIHHPEPYFIGHKKKHTPEEMIDFCNGMIERADRKGGLKAFLDGLGEPEEEKPKEIEF